MAAQAVAATDKRGPGTQTALVSGGRKKIHTTYQNGEEQVEEFDLTTDELLGAPSDSIFTADLKHVHVSRVFLSFLFFFQ